MAENVNTSNDLDKSVNAFFEAKESALVTETLKIFRDTDDVKLKLECLKLLNEIRG